MPDVDNLSIQIKASADSADKALNKLVGTIGKISASLGGLNFNNFANGVKNLSSAMQGLQNVKMPDYNRLARGISQIGSINSAQIQQAGVAIRELSGSLKYLDNINVTDNAKQIADLAKGISQLGYKSSTKAIDNIPKLAVAMRQLMNELSKAPKVSQNLIDMTNALAKLSRTGASSGRAANALGKSLGSYTTSTHRASKGTWSLARAFGKMYASYFLVFRAIKGLWSSIESTADYIEAYNYFNVALEKIGSEWSHQYEDYGYENAEAYAESFKTRLSKSLSTLSGVQITTGSDGNGLLTETGMKNLGLNIQEVTQYASQLASVTNSVGQTGEVSLAAASAFTKLSADMSSLFNLDYSDVMKNIQSGLIGQSRALYKYGIDITNATLQTYAYELGIEKAVSEMTQAEKMQLRMIAILDQSKVSWGDLANTIESPSNQIRIFKNNMSELGMMIGQLFVPMMTKVLPVINGISVALKRLITDIAGFMGIKINFNEFGQGYTDTEDTLEDVEGSYEDVTDAVKEYKNQLMGFDEINKLQDTSATATLDTDSSGLDLTEDILTATEKYEKAWADAYAQMNDNANKIADNIMKYFEPLKNLFKNISIGDWFAVGEDVSNITTGIFNAISRAIDDVNWQKIGKNIGKFLAGIDWLKMFKALTKILGEAFNAIFELAGGMIKESPLESAIVLVMSGWKLKGIGSAIMSLFSKHPIITTATIIAGIAVNWEEIVDYIWSGGLEIADAAVTPISDAVTKISEEAEKLSESYKELSLTNETSISSITTKFAAIKSMAEKYLTLSQNYETLSDSQKELVKVYANSLSENLPEISNNIDAITGKWTGTKDELNTVITQTEEYYKKLAKSNILQGLYETQVEAEKLTRESLSAFKEKAQYIVENMGKLYDATGNIDYGNIIGLAGELYAVNGNINQLSHSSKKLYDYVIKTNEVWSVELRELAELGSAYDKSYGTLEDVNKEIAYYSDISEEGIEISKDLKKATVQTAKEFENTSSSVFKATNAMQDGVTTAKKLTNTLNGIKSPNIKVDVNTTNAVKQIQNMMLHTNNMIKGIDDVNINAETTTATNKINGLVYGTNVSLSSITTPQINAYTSPAINAINKLVSSSNKTLENIKTPTLTINTANVINSVISVADKVKNLFKDAFKFDIGLNMSKSISSVINSLTSGASIGVSVLGSVGAFATGGFPDKSSFFFAGEHGVPELLGTVGGRTAVAGGAEITGIADAVYNTGATEIELLRQQNELLNQLLHKDMGISDKNIFKSVRKSASNYLRQTGKSAFA